MKIHANTTKEEILIDQEFGKADYYGKGNLENRYCLPAGLSVMRKNERNMD